MITNSGGVYAAMKFDPYVFREYPKFIKTGKGKNDFVIVENQRDELAMLSEHPQEPTAQDAVLADVAMQLAAKRNETEELREQVAELKKLLMATQGGTVEGKAVVEPVEIPASVALDKAGAKLALKLVDPPARPE